MISVTTPQTAPPASAPRGFWFMRDIPTLLWLVATVVAVFIHRFIPSPRWLMIHLLLLGAITHAILVWSQYFSYALLRRSASVSDRHRQTARLCLANGGAALVVVGVPTQIWPLTAAGASLLVVAVVWHAVSLYTRSRKSLPGRFSKTVRYYITSAAFLAIGAVLGALAALGISGVHLQLAHAIVNLLGWIGLTVAGTLVTLWPTMLGTPADSLAARGASRVLPVLIIGIAVAAAGAAYNLTIALLVGFIAYLAGLFVIAFSGWREARTAAPRAFAPLSVAAAFLWWIGCLAWMVGGTIFDLVGGVAGGSATLLHGAVPFLAAGFAAQVLIGALSHLVPVVIGGGPDAIRVGTDAFGKYGVLRVCVANLALAVCALPVSSLVRVVASLLYLIAVASFLFFMLRAMPAQRRAKKQLAQSGHIEETTKTNRPAGQVVAGLVTVSLAVATAIAIDPASTSWSTAPAGAQNAPVTSISMTTKDMRFTPDEIEVPAGNRLVIHLKNTDQEQAHDLVFANGVSGSRLSPGESETVDVGVIHEDLDGWCSIVGHRQMGMTLKVKAVGGSSEAAGPATHENSSPDHGASDKHDMSAHSGDDAIDLMGKPGRDFTPYSAELAPLPEQTTPVTHKETLVARDVEKEVAPGVTQRMWTYNGTAPGPTLHGRVGDRFEITLVNKGDMGHSIDFHAGSLAPDQPMRTIQPGEKLTYTFTAERSGIWMYHCSTMPMSSHIANGMYGAVVIEPDDLPSVDKSYALVQGEYYLGERDGGEVNPDKIEQRAPDLVTFNGYANQYDHEPLSAAVGERVRVWVLDAGIERPSSFHVIGGQFDTVWSEGRYLINREKNTGSQALGLMPAQGGFVELTFPEAGHYPFVSHFMIDAEHGAHGIFDVKK
jgi:nitrite reductase (NO-forming)